MNEITKLDAKEFEELQIALTDKWEKAILTKDGKHKRHVMYGDARKQSINQSSFMLYVCGIPFSVMPLCELLFGEFERCAEERGAKISIVLQNNLEDELKKWRREYRSLSFVIEREDRVASMLARSETILVLGILPAYFTLREDQQVIQICRGLDERIEEGVLVRALTSRLLNTTALFVSSEAERDLVIDTCNLRGIYQGKILQLLDDDETAAKAVCTYVLSGQAEPPFELLDASTDKKKVVIYCRTYEDDYWCTARRIIGATDLDTCDVTLVVPNNIRYLRITRHIDELPDRVRVISREPTFPCGSREYVRLQVALDSYRGYDTFDDWFESFGKDAARLEAQRLLGRATFDSFVYVGELSSLWAFFAFGVDATVKKKVEKTNLAERQLEEPKNNRFTFEMEMQGDKRLFDELCFIDEELYEQAKSVATHMSICLYDLPIDSENSYHDIELKRNVTWGDKNLYLVYQFEDRFSAFASMIEMPDASEAYLVEGQEESLLDGLAAIEKSASDNAWIAMVFDVQSPETEKEVYRFYATHAKMISDSRCLGFYSIPEYLKLFSGVVVPDRDVHSCLRIAADAYGLPVFYPTDDGLVRAEKPLFATVSEVERYIANQCNRLYGWM